MVWLLIRLKHRVLHQLLKKNRSNDCAFHRVDNQQKSRNSGNQCPSHKRVSSKRLEKCQPKAVLVGTIAVDPNREHGLNIIDTSCDLFITILLSHIDDIRFWSVLSFSVAEETRLTGNVIAYVAFVTSKRGRVGRIRAREEGEEGMPARTL